MSQSAPLPSAIVERLPQGLREIATRANGPQALVALTALESISRIRGVPTSRVRAAQVENAMIGHYPAAFYGTRFTTSLPRDRAERAGSGNQLAQIHTEALVNAERLFTRVFMPEEPYDGYHSPDPFDQYSYQFREAAALVAQHPDIMEELVEYVAEHSPAPSATWRPSEHTTSRIRAVASRFNTIDGGARTDLGELVIEVLKDSEQIARAATTGETLISVELEKTDGAHKAYEHLTKESLPRLSEAIDAWGIHPDFPAATAFEKFVVGLRDSVRDAVGGAERGPMAMSTDFVDVVNDINQRAELLFAGEFERANPSVVSL